MKKFLFGIIIALVVVIFMINRSCATDTSEDTIKESTLIQEQIKNVGKLVVTEGHFSEVLDYKNSKEIFGDYITADKKALVVVNADVTISYDLSQIEIEVDEVNKVITILSIPSEEIKISPDLEYYDVQADFLNPFEAEDYNKIKEEVKESLMKKVNASNLRSNAENRLISELSKFYILSNSMGWELRYNKNTLNSLEELKQIQF